MPFVFHMSHPMWVRGLKLYEPLYIVSLTLVAPHVGAWIETLYHAHAANFASSHPMWVRGLKPLITITRASRSKSHPMWVRGLKLYAIGA